MVRNLHIRVLPCSSCSRPLCYESDVRESFAIAKAASDGSFRRAATCGEGHGAVSPAPVAASLQLADRCFLNTERGLARQQSRHKRRLPCFPASALARFPHRDREIEFAEKVIHGTRKNNNDKNNNGYPGHAADDLCHQRIRYDHRIRTR